MYVCFLNSAHLYKLNGADLENWALIALSPLAILHVFLLQVKIAVARCCCCCQLLKFHLWRECARDGAC
jgi:hypothetical protein